LVSPHPRREIPSPTGTFAMIAEAEEPRSLVREAIAAGERRAEINRDSFFLSEYDSSFGGHQ
jgi:hypothetical protein